MLNKRETAFEAKMRNRELEKTNSPFEFILYAAELNEEERAEILAELEDRKEHQTPLMNTRVIDKLRSTLDSLTKFFQRQNS
jgi:hypothetical protein